MALPTPLPRSIYIDRFTSSRPDFVLVTPIAAKTRKQQTTAGGWVLRSGRGKLREIGSTPAALPATSRATNPRQHRPQDLSKPQRDIHLVEIKYCRPQNQLNAAKEQHKDACIILQGAFVILHVILLGVCGRHHLQHSHSEAFEGTGSWFSKSKEVCLHAPCALCELCC